MKEEKPNIYKEVGKQMLDMFMKEEGKQKPDTFMEGKRAQMSNI